MSFELLSKTAPKARKDYYCIWCGEKILKGEHYSRVVGVFYGELQSSCYHVECENASHVYFRLENEEEFMPHEFKRGSTQPRWCTMKPHD